MSSRSYLLFVSSWATRVSLLYFYLFIWLCQVLRHLGSYFPACMLSCFSHVQLFGTPRTVVCQVPLSMRFSRKDYWIELPCPPPGDLSNPGMEPGSPVSPALQVDYLPLKHSGSTILTRIFFFLISLAKSLLFALIF